MRMDTKYLILQQNQMELLIFPPNSVNCQTILLRWLTKPITASFPTQSLLSLTIPGKCELEARFNSIETQSIVINILGCNHDKGNNFYVERGQLTLTVQLGAFGCYLSGGCTRTLQFIMNQEKPRNFKPPDPFLDAIASLDWGYVSL